MKRKQERTWLGWTGLLLLCLGLSGCTLFPEKIPPTLAMSTGAEQHERIFWKLVQEGQWNQVEPLMASNLVWSLPGRVLGRGEAIQMLQQQRYREILVRDATIKPNNNDMTVTATVIRVDAQGQSHEAQSVAVWQQLDTSKTPKKERPANSWILTVYSEHPR